MKKKYLIVILTLIIIGIFITVVSTSYAYLKREVDTGKKVEFKVGTLNYKIESSDLNNNKLIIPSNSNKTINIDITSLNAIDSKYELYYKFITKLTNEDRDNVVVGYSLDSLDSANGTILSKKTKKIIVKIMNNTNKNIELEFGVEGGLLNNELVIDSGYEKIKKPTVLQNGEEVRTIFESLAGDVKNINSIKRVSNLSNTVETREINNQNNEGKVLAYYNSNDKTIYVYSDSYIYMPPYASVMFFDMSNLTNIELLKFVDTSSTYELHDLFNNCTSLSDITPLKNWDTSNFTFIRSIFFNCQSLKTVESLKNWDISKLSILECIFTGCSSLTSLTGLENWNTTNINGIESAFNGCISLIDIDAIKNWNMSNVTNINATFNMCISIKDLSILNNWNLPNTTKPTNWTFNGIPETVIRPIWAQ